jgi:hypothetical protein
MTIIVNPMIISRFLIKNIDKIKNMGHIEKLTPASPRPEIEPAPQKPQKPQKHEEMDLCVNCGKPTIYPKNMHIAYRMHYVEGAGQLCTECYDEIYNTRHE